MRNLLLISATLLSLMPALAPAQGLFSPVLRVNEDAITGYELNQRITLLRAFGTPGNVPQIAEEQLIDDALKIQAAEQMGITLSPEEIQAGVAELASRGNLSAEDFIANLAGDGVDPATLEAFVVPGLAWRQVVRQRFAGQANVTEDEIDRAMSLTGSGGGLRVLLAEIILPARPEVPGEIEQATEIANRVSKTTSPAEFSAAARNYSATASRQSGGRMPWMAITELPPILRPIVLSIGINDVTQPIEIPNGIALFQLRGIEETEAPAPEYAAIEYAQYLIPGGQTPEALAEAKRIAGTTDTCNDLYGINKGQDPARLERTSLPPAQIPSDIAIELSKLDAGETSTAITRNGGQTLVLLMMCGRTAAINEEASREDVANNLRNQRLGASADSYLGQLKADARIVRP
ncbi:MAG: peptidylprolyl isomerase [Donghicola eburneus]|nr:peptidylprolyl isomerase [Donghicola eburneus]MCI5039057.1 peptidylprolyl isomerase [Donghicola eburneus]